MLIENLEILPQPNDETCGATCLHAIYKFYGEGLDLHELIPQVSVLESGGTLAVALGTHALEKGYNATIYTYNLHVFDPTWFVGNVNISEKIRLQLQYKNDVKIKWASEFYLKFLAAGGEIKFEELNKKLIKKFLDKKLPILTGLNATYLYREARELNNEQDDIRGFSMGHFVVLSGYDKDRNEVTITDPLLSNPFSNHKYLVPFDRLINSIMLGILTYDANLLIIEKK